MHKPKIIYENNSQQGNCFRIFADNELLAIVHDITAVELFITAVYYTFPKTVEGVEKFRAVKSFIPNSGF